MVSRTLEWAGRWRWLPYLAYALLSLAILGPLLQPGYILTLDMVFTPDMDYAGQLYGLDEWLVVADAPRYLFIQLLSNIAPAWLVQKVILFLIFFLCGVGAHRLSPSGGVGSYFAGLLYTVNPFTYVRFLAGQWGMLAAFALIPFALKAFLDLMENASIKNAMKVALLSSLVGIFQLHGFFLLFGSFIIVLLIRLLVKRREPATLIQLGKYVGFSAAMFLGLNLYWLVPTLTATGTIIQQIGFQDLIFFAAKPTSSLGIAFDIVSMHGFWRGGYIYTKDILPFWWLLFSLILFLAVHGFWTRYRDPRLGWKVVSLSAIASVSFLLALGAAITVTQPFWQWAGEHVPLLGAFRDSQKYIALLCLAYSYLGGLGAAEISQEVGQRKKRMPRAAGTIAVIIILLTPLGYNFTMFGFQGHVGTTDYPREWYQVNEYLNRDEDDYNVLFLPWHLYMDYSWLPNRDQRLINPAGEFLDKPVIAGDNIEVPGIYSQSTRPVSKYIEFLLDNKDKLDNFGELLAPLNIKYVILAHEADFESLQFLYQQPDLSLVLENEELTLFRNEYGLARAYAVDSTVLIDSLDDYLALSQEHDVMEHLYLIDSTETPEPDAGTVLHPDSAYIEEIKSAEASPVRYRLAGSQRSYTIFTVPQKVSSNYWEYNGEPALKNLGIMPAFSSSGDGGEVIYTRFYHVYLPGYIISIVTLLSIAGYYSFSAIRKRKQPLSQ